MLFWETIKLRLVLKKIRKIEIEHNSKLPTGPDEDIAFGESGVWQEHFKTADNIYEWRQLELTSYLEKAADELLVVLPSKKKSEFWTRVEWDDDPAEPYYLTLKGVAEAKRAIREEQKARREAIAFWIPIVFGCTGLLMGVLALLKH